MASQGIAARVLPWIARRLELNRRRYVYSEAFRYTLTKVPHLSDFVGYGPFLRRLLQALIIEDLGAEKSSDLVDTPLLWDDTALFWANWVELWRVAEILGVSPNDLSLHAAIEAASLQ